tara:strand:+ start:38926 stop:39405 length:480 start_codon:yes stop_codon:yes gene_type:complete
MPDNVRYVTAWQRNDPKCEADAVSFWQETRMLPPDVDPRQRAKEIVSMAYQGDRVVGVTTAEVAYLEQVRQKFALMRILIHPDLEKSGVSVPLTIHAREVLREWAKANPQEKVAGYAAIITAPGYGQKPVLPAGLVLIGYNAQGRQVRVYWFDHFRIEI